MILVGLRRGISGELGTLAGAIAGVAAGVFLFPFVREQVAAWECCAAAPALAAGVADFVLGLVVFGVARGIVARFFSLLVPQPTNALLGALSGCVKTVLLVGALALVGHFQAGSCAEGFLADHSTVLRVVGGYMDLFAAGFLP